MRVNGYKYKYIYKRFWLYVLNDRNKFYEDFGVIYLVKCLSVYVLVIFYKENDNMVFFYIYCYEESSI